MFTTEIAGLQPWTDYYYRCMAANSKGVAWAATCIPFSTKGILPSNWETTFIGYEQRSGGGANYDSGTFTVKGSGRDIGETSQTIDNFQYAYKSLDGDGEITARVLGIAGKTRDPKAGIMIRETLDDSSKSVSVILSSRTGIRLISLDGDARRGASTPTNQIDAPYWLRIVRSANTFTGYISGDGSTWTQIGSPAKIAMTDRVYVGLAVTAGNRDGSRLSTSTFDNVTIRE